MCIVKGCTNRQHEGGFIGDLCRPCHTMLVEGRTMPSKAWFVVRLNEPMTGKQIHKAMLERIDELWKVRPVPVEFTALVDACVAFEDVAYPIWDEVEGMKENQDD